MKAVPSATLVLLLGQSAVAGCSNPYALGVNRLNYDAPQMAGSILFTDPKLYKREALINERRLEVEYIDELIRESPKATFTPEIARELQTVTSLAAAIGVNFDPAAGTNYRRDLEATEIEQEIRMMRLQLQLEQLKRDAELFRQGLATQTAPVNAGLGTLSQSTVQDLDSNVTAGSAAQLLTAIGQLQATLTTANVTNAMPLNRTNLTSSPVDTFLDRAAYRGMLNSARNAASLDELHDKDGAALVRLSLTATLLPPPATHIDTLGVLRMEVRPPDWTYEVMEKLYRDWLDYINGVLSTETGGVFREDPELLGLRTVGDLFDSVYYHFGGDACPGLSFSPNANQSCQELVLGVPRALNLFGPTNPGRDRVSDLVGVLTDTQAFEFDVMFGSAASAIMNPAAAPVFERMPDGSCGIDDDSPTLKREVRATRNSMLPVRNVIAAALDVYWVSVQLSVLEIQAQRTLRGRGTRSRADLIEQLARPNRGAGRVVTALIDTGRKVGCTIAASDYVLAYVPFRFMDQVLGESRVAIYEVGPREQAQQLSTLARASEAIGLAAAIAGQIPTQGIGMNGNIAYSRSATGRADALERVPLLISFAEPASEPAGAGVGAAPRSAPAFGWLMGPRMTLDPEKQELVLEQRLKPYDLSVDLSVPGWWPSVTLEASTAWAPNWRNGAGRMVADNAPARRITVGLSPNRADFSALTDRLRGTSSIRRAEIREVRPTRISACATNLSLEISGENIWRAGTVVIGGRAFASTALTVLPDMRGVLVKIDRAAFPVPTDTITLSLTAMTPYGEAKFDGLTLVDVKPDGTCKIDPPGPQTDQAPPAQGGRAAQAAPGQPAQQAAGQAQGS